MFIEFKQETGLLAGSALGATKSFQLEIKLSEANQKLLEKQAKIQHLENQLAASKDNHTQRLKVAFIKVKDETEFCNHSQNGVYCVHIPCD